jgi:hypothetical protein
LLSPSPGFRLPDVGENFPTHALLVGLAVGEQPLAGRDDRDAEATEDLGQAGALRVDAQTGLADPADAGDRALTAAAVLELDLEGLADGGLALGVGVVGDLYGIATESWYAWLALRRRVSMSAIGSVIVMAGSALSRCGFQP